MTVVVDYGQSGQREQFELPVYDVTQEGEYPTEWASIDRLSEQLEQSGQHFRRTLRLAPVQLDDGRHLVIPVSELELIPAHETWVP